MNLLFNPSSWEAKDYLTAISSLFALIFSFVTYLQKILEKKRAFRIQLTNILDKLTAITIESEKYKALVAAGQGQIINYQGLLNDQRRFYVRQADFLARNIKRQVGPFEWNLIAIAWQQIDEAETAEERFKLAVKESKSLVDKGLTSRSLARFYIQDNKWDLSNTWYQYAIDAFSGTSDRMIYYRAVTYERWAYNFKGDDFKSKIQSAIGEWEVHSNLKRREEEKARISALQIPIV